MNQVISYGWYKLVSLDDAELEKLCIFEIINNLHGYCNMNFHQCLFISNQVDGLQVAWSLSGDFRRENLAPVTQKNLSQICNV